MKLDNMVVETYVKRVAESEEDFIIETILPYCENILEKKINKKELKEIIINGQKASMRWISTKDRLPTEAGVYLVTVKDLGGVYIYDTDVYWERWNRYGDVIAWMPIPEFDGDA